MAIDSASHLGASSDPETSVIENEIPAYRAISARAVTSVVLGMASVFCFTSLWFTLVAAAAVVFGWAALRAIKRLPEILTGSSLAKTGIGLALVFSLTAITRAVVEDVMMTYDAGEFSKLYVATLQNEPIASAVYFKQPPSYRKEKTPAQLEEELKKSKSPANNDVYATETAAIRSIKEELKKPNAGIHFSKIESKLIDGATQYANALVDIDAPDGEQFALLELMKEPGAGWGEWRIREIRFPYKPASSGVRQEKKDDGHGHG